MDFLQGFNNFVKQTTNQVDTLLHHLTADPSATASIPPHHSTDQSYRDADGPQSLHQPMSKETEDALAALVADVNKARALFIGTDAQCVDEAALDTFVMSEERIAHARTVIRRIPQLDQLRFELCPSVFSDSRFWYIYFMILERIKKGTPQADSSKFVKSDSLPNQKIRILPKLQIPSVNPAVVQSEIAVHPRHLPSTPSSVELSPLSNMIYSGARQTLQIAETLIEAVDETAGLVIRPTISPKAIQITALPGKPSLPLDDNGEKMLVPLESVGKEPKQRRSGDAIEEHKRTSTEVTFADVDDWSLVDVDRAKSCGRGGVSDVNDQGFHLV